MFTGFKKLKTSAFEGGWTQRSRHGSFRRSFQIINCATGSTAVQHNKYRCANYIKQSRRHFGRAHSLDSKAVHEHDVVPEGSVDVQVNLFDLSGEATSLLLHFLEDGFEWKYLGQLCEMIFFETHSFFLEKTFDINTSYLPSFSFLTLSMSSSKAQAWPLSPSGMPLYTRFTN